MADMVWLLDFWEIPIYKATMTQLVDTIPPGTLLPHYQRMRWCSTIHHLFMSQNGKVLRTASRSLASLHAAMESDTRGALAAIVFPGVSTCVEGKIHDPDILYGKYTVNGKWSRAWFYRRTSSSTNLEGFEDMKRDD